MKDTKLKKYIDKKLIEFPQLKHELEEILDVYSECIADGSDEKLEYMAGKDAVNATISELKATR